MQDSTDVADDPLDASAFQASVLFVRGGADAMEFVYSEQHVGYWSAGFEAVLAQHGWTDLHTAEPDVLEHPHLLRRHDAVIVCWLPEWKTAWLRALRSYDGVIFLEGPIPPLLESFTGLERVQSELQLDQARLRLPGWLRDSIGIRDRDSEQRPIYLDSRDAQSDPGIDDALIADLDVAYANAYLSRLRRGEAVFPHDPHNDALALLALAMYASRLPSGLERDMTFASVRDGLRADVGTRVRGRRAARQRRAAAEAARYAALALVGEHGDDAIATTRSESWANAVARSPLRGGPQARRLGALRAYAAAISNQSDVALELLQSAGPLSHPVGDDAVTLWLTELTQSTVSRVNTPHRSQKGWLDLVAQQLTSGSPPVMPSSIEGWNVVDLLPLAAALRRRGATAASDALMRSLLSECLDRAALRMWSGTVRNGVLRRGSTYVLAPAALLGLLGVGHGGLGVPRARIAGRHSSSDLHQQIAGRSPHHLTGFRNVSGEDEISIELDESEIAGLVRRGRVLTSTFRLLGHVVQARASSVETDRAQAAAILEAAFFALLEEQLSRYGRDHIRIDQADPPSLMPLRSRVVLNPGGIIGIEPHPSLGAAGGMQVRKLADGRDSCLYELVGTAERPPPELLFSCPRHLFHGVGADGATIDVAPAPGRVEGARIRISQVHAERICLRIRRTRPARYDEVAAAIAASGDRDKQEYAPDELLPRLSNLTEVINRFTPFPDLTHLHVADIGCGYGPFPLATYLVERPSSLTGIDASAEVVRLAESLAREVGTDATTFRHGDLLRLDSDLDGVDLLLALNVLYYLPNRRQHRKAARACVEALRPGGAFVALVTNRLHPVDAFTGMRWVHRLPRGLAHRYVRLRGARHGYKDVRSPSPTELVRTYQGAGFESVQLVDSDQITRVENPRSYAKPRFYLVAVKPLG